MAASCKLPGHWRHTETAKSPTSRRKAKPAQLHLKLCSVSLSNETSTNLLLFGCTQAALARLRELVRRTGKTSSGPKAPAEPIHPRKAGIRPSLKAASRVSAFRQAYAAGKCAYGWPKGFLVVRIRAPEASYTRHYERRPACGQTKKTRDWPSS